MCKEKERMTKMAVAKTYQHMEIQGEPFEENKRMYVNVLAPKGLKKVRWYTDAEYRKMYPETEETKNSIMDFNGRYAFGFRDAGYITIYKGTESELEAFMEEHREFFWRNLTFGYYTPSHINVPELPHNITPIKLYWEEVMDYDDRMKPHEEVIPIVAAKLGTKNNSTYQGEENEWLEKEVTVRENKTYETQYGDKHTHYMVDAEGNTYIWETGTKNYTSGTTIKLKMKVKTHKEVKGEKCTVVWYCKEC